MTTRNVAIFLPPNMTFYREMISGALDYAGLHPEIVIHHNPERELSELEISGVLAMCYADSELLHTVNALGIPFVNLTASEDAQQYCVTYDNYQTGQVVGKYLAKNGFKNAVFVGLYNYQTFSRLRFAGLSEVFETIGGRCEEVLIAPDLPEFEVGGWGVSPETYVPLVGKLSPQYLVA